MLGVGRDDPVAGQRSDDARHQLDEDDRRQRHEQPVFVGDVAHDRRHHAREAAERAHQHHHSRCPVAKSIGDCIAIATELEFAD